MNLNRLLFGLVSAVFSIYSEQGLCQQELTVVFHDDTTANCIKSYEYTVIIYVKPEGCISCAMSNLISPWEVYKKRLARYNTGILLVIDGTPEQHFDNILKSFSIPHCHTYDRTRKFRTSNDKIFQAAHGGIFVIDKEKNVIFTGSPIATVENWNSFVKLMNVRSQ
jgi:hypothetical protein